MFLEIMCANAIHHFNFNLWLVINLLGLSLFPKSCKVLQDYLSFFHFCLHVSCITFAFIKINIVNIQIWTLVEVDMKL